LKRSAVLVAWVLVVGSSPALAAVVSVDSLARRTANATARLEIGFVPQTTWLEQREGGNEDSALLLRVSPTTFVVSSPGLGREFRDRANGLVHCYGPAAGTCEFIPIGPLAEDRRALRVNDSTVVIQGLGPDGEGCEGPGMANDVLYIVRGLGAPGATVETNPALSNLCLFLQGTDPIRVNDDTVVFSQPRSASRSRMTGRSRGSAPSADPCRATSEDGIIVMSGLRPGAALKVTTLNVGSLLGVHLSGGPAGRAVRLSDTAVAWASPGADGHFAFIPIGGDVPEDVDRLCGVTKENKADDGLVVLKLVKGGTPVLQWMPIGVITANPAGRPLRVNDSAVVLVGGGADREEQEPVTVQSPLSGLPVSSQVIVVEGLGKPHTTVTFFPGFGGVRRPVRLGQGTVAFFDEEAAGAKSKEDVLITANLVRGIGGSDSDPDVDGACPVAKGPLSLVTVPIATGHGFVQTDKTREDVGVVLNCTQVVFWVNGSRVTDQQAFLLTDLGTKVPRLAPSSTPAGALWDRPRAGRVNRNTAAYNVAHAKAPLGLLKASSSGELTDLRLQLPPDALPSPPCGDPQDGESLHQPSSQPVRLSDSRVVVLSKGKDGGFSKLPQPPNCPGAVDDGLIVIEGADTGAPTARYVGFWNSCGGPGCKPLALGTPGKEIVVVGGFGQAYKIGEQLEHDHELVIVTLP
jgi:hypothetical protein